jgi:hypothetical protein
MQALMLVRSEWDGNYFEDLVHTSAALTLYKQVELILQQAVIARSVVRRRGHQTFQTIGSQFLARLSALLYIPTIY